MGTVTVVLELCGLNSTYAVTENESVFVDHGDGHEVGFEVMAFTHKIEVSIGGCAPVLYVYPTAQMEGQYSSDHPIIFTLAVGLLFGMSILLFSLYDKNIRTRQVSSSKARRSNHDCGDALSHALRCAFIPTE
jgi:hypothetical protein